MENIKIYLCDWWAGFNVNNNFIVSVLKKHYNVKIDPISPDFLIYSVFGYSHIRYKNCVKIFYTGEPVEPNFNECDYAIGYSPMNFGKRYFQLKRFVNFSEAEINTDLLRRKFCNFIYSQDESGEGALLRRQFCQMLMKYKKVDAPGKILNNMKEASTPRTGDWVNGKLEFIKNYKFTFAIENASMEGYVTEKLQQALQMHSIPIYWGAPDVEKYFNTKSFVHLRDFKNLNEAAEYIRYLDNNDDEYMKILKTNPNLPNNSCNGSLGGFLCSIIERGNNPFSKNPRMLWEQEMNTLYNNTARLAEMYFDSDDTKRAKECAEMCLSLDMRNRIFIYPLLEDIYRDNKNDFIVLLDRQKENIMRCPIVRPEYLKELCKIATCFIHLGEEQMGTKLVEYVLQKDPDNLEAKKVLQEKGKRGGRAKNNVLPNRDYVVKSWEEFQDFGHTTSEQRANVLSFCLKYPTVRFVHNQKSYQAYKELLRLWRPFSMKGVPLVRVGAKNYGGHTMAEPGNKGIAVGVGDYYSEWNFQMAERGFTVYQYGENISEPPKKHTNLKFKKILFTKEPVTRSLAEILSLKDYPTLENVVMQMDVRGKEWEILEAMTESQLKCFRQFAVDFHDLVNESRIELYAKVFRKLNKTHRIVNLHYNNNVSFLCFKDFLIANVIRITYVRRDAGEFSVSEESFPVSNDNQTISSLPEVHIGRFSDILDVEKKFVDEQSNFSADISWKEYCQEAVLYTDWLKKKNIYISRNDNSSAGYNFLYALCRLLNEYYPNNILEFEFDQATKITAQYASSHEASLTVLANNRERVEHFMRNWRISWNNVLIQGSALIEAMENGNTGVVYQNFTGATRSKKYNLILLKSPLGKKVLIHMDILFGLPELLEDDFAILMDHVEDDCGKMVFKSMMDILEQKGISFLRKDFPARSHLVSVIFSESWKYIEEF